MAKQKKEVVPKRGEIYLVNFDPTLGAEIRKTRPALILQNDIANRYSPVTIVAAVTSKFSEPLYPTEIFVSGREGGLKQDSVILLNQVRSVDKQRLVERLGMLNKDTLEKVDCALEISLGLAKI
jgi:mRNA interferase MazF